MSQEKQSDKDSIQKNQSQKHNQIWPLIVSFLLTAAVYCIISAISGIHTFNPQGQFTWARNDGYYQYLDFMAWMKDVLEGKQSILYSFSNGLGKTSIDFYSYYLASPFNLLLYFFDKTELTAFFDLTILLKVSFSAATCGRMLQRRFQGIRPLWIIAGGVSYALMYYNLGLNFNIM